MARRDGASASGKPRATRPGAARDRRPRGPGQAPHDLSDDRWHGCAHDAFEFGHSWVLDRFPRAAAGSTAPVPSVQAVASALQAFLAEHSFEPTTELRGEHIDISLWQCPFLGLVDRYGEVICALHDGVIAGLIAASDVPATCHELRPFDRPDRCLVTLSPTSRGFPAAFLCPPAQDRAR